MSSRVSGRPRRTRIYGANYDLGESYYKSALDGLDRKQYCKSSPIPDIPVPTVPTTTPTTTPIAPIRKTRFALDEDNDFGDALQNARARAHRAITDESALFDSKVGRIRSLALGGDEIDQDVQDSLSRIRASRQQNMTSLVNELSLDDALNTSSLKPKVSKSLSDDNDDLASSVKSRGRKILWRVENEEPVFESSKSIVSKFKKSVMANETAESSTSSSSAASKRAQATKARLADIESDMFDRTEKLLEREKRAANLKKMLADSDFE